MGLIHCSEMIEGENTTSTTLKSVKIQKRRPRDIFRISSFFGLVKYILFGGVLASPPPKKTKNCKPFLGKKTWIRLS